MAHMIWGSFYTILASPFVSLVVRRPSVRQRCEVQFGSALVSLVEGEVRTANQTLFCNFGSVAGWHYFVSQTLIVGTVGD